MKKIILLLLLFPAAAFSQDLQPTETAALVKISVTDFKKNPRKETVIFEATKTKKNFEVTSDEKGNAELLLPKGDTYKVKYKSFLDRQDYSSVKIPGEEGLFTSTIKIQIEEEEGKTYTLKDVFFDTGKSSFKPESFKALNELADAMKAKPTLVIEISGHTDNVGTPESNLKLSQERADAVRGYLLKKGIAASRVTAVGFGDTQPVADNETAEGKAKNRRTEVRIVKEEPPNPRRGE